MHVDRERLAEKSLGESMPSIRIDGCENLNKVAMTKAINLNSPFNLQESKFITDRLLKEGAVNIELNETFDVINLLKSLHSANANVTFKE